MRIMTLLLVAGALLGACDVPDRSGEAIQNFRTSQPRPAG